MGNTHFACLYSSVSLCLYGVKHVLMLCIVMLREFIQFLEVMTSDDSTPLKGYGAFIHDSSMPTEAKIAKSVEA